MEIIFIKQTNCDKWTKNKMLKWQLCSSCVMEKNQIHDDEKSNSHFIHIKTGDLPFAQCWGNGPGRLRPGDLSGCCRWAWAGTNPCEWTSSCRRSRTPRSPEFLGCHLYLPPSQKVSFQLLILPTSCSHLSTQGGYRSTDLKQAHIFIPKNKYL